MMKASKEPHPRSFSAPFIAYSSVGVPCYGDIGEDVQRSGPARDRSNLAQKEPVRIIFLKTAPFIPGSSVLVLEPTWER